MAPAVTLLKAVAESVSLFKTHQLFTPTGKLLLSKRIDAHHGQTAAEMVKLTLISLPQVSTISNTPLLTVAEAVLRKTPTSTNGNHQSAELGGTWEAALNPAKTNATISQEVSCKMVAPCSQSGVGLQETPCSTTKLLTAQVPISTLSETPSMVTVSSHSTVPTKRPQLLMKLFSDS